jgi:hypothetical protein
MAVRLNRFNAESVRQKIQAGQLIERLQNHALKQTAMKSTEIDAAKFLLNKRIPNLPEQTDVNLTGSMTLNWPLPKTGLDQ